jgi:hypothetical protein
LRLQPLGLNDSASTKSRETILFGLFRLKRIAIPEKHVYTHGDVLIPGHRHHSHVLRSNGLEHGVLKTFTPSDVAGIDALT